MALEQVQVSKSLDRKLKVFGFEIPDILFIFLILSVLNLVFSSHPYKLILTFGPSALFALFLRLAKRNKPDNYLIHYLKFKNQPKYLSAFKNASVTPQIKRKRQNYEHSIK